ncbi:uncharacterized protein SPPG_08984 [Spizellomyces punctatus DAOM BR117]|uniref:Formin GTPase-binding domain-containing protein n=1 Tax=Spizellomyces punctatus (strain DAOM BR117) TaxID=645134 RepID=A0A0L0HPP3_SPIPD|nr:uncharacterized protein SPPG_08984 [Spizellomyces punctatus DAOM BR117]KND03023.1 hypothetical protein SPPG_08984 [Spizellomyces punctatus DAOM BR117]|eukprot:XP_016611062.1 hypothetical protein SPPG_08984 [Spizellomyces punctatus DAOM BR117]
MFPFARRSTQPSHLQSSDSPSTSKKASLVSPQSNDIVETGLGRESPGNARDERPAGDQEVMPDPNVIDGWFDEIMESLLPETSAQKYPHDRAAQIKLDAESKWALVRAYRSKSSLFDEKAGKGTTPTGPRQQPSSPLDFTMFLMAYVGDGDTVYTADETLLNMIRKLRICVACELVGWTETFLQYDGLVYLTNLMRNISDKAEKSPHDWTLHLELTRTLRTLCCTQPFLSYLMNSGSILSHLCRILFGWWKQHHHHSDHWDRCIGRIPQVISPEESGKSKPKPRYQACSEIPEPSILKDSSTRPPMANRRVGLEVLSLVIEHGGWKCVVMALDTVAGASSVLEGDIIGCRDSNEFLPTPVTFMPWISVTHQVTLNRLRHWAGLTARAHSIYHTLKHTMASSKHYRYKNVPKTVPALEEGDGVEDADVVRYLKASIRFAVVLVSPGNRPNSESPAHIRRILDVAGWNKTLQKLKQSPHSSILATVERYMRENIDDASRTEVQAGTTQNRLSRPQSITSRHRPVLPTAIRPATSRVRSQRSQPGLASRRKHDAATRVAAQGSSGVVGIRRPGRRRVVVAGRSHGHGEINEHSLTSDESDPRHTLPNVAAAAENPTTTPEPEPEDNISPSTTVADGPNQEQSESSSWNNVSDGEDTCSDDTSSSEGEWDFGAAEGPGHDVTPAAEEPSVNAT